MYNIQETLQVVNRRNFGSKLFEEFVDVTVLMHLNASIPLFKI